MKQKSFAPFFGIFLKIKSFALPGSNLEVSTLLNCSDRKDGFLIHFAMVEQLFLLQLIWTKRKKQGLLTLWKTNFLGRGFVVWQPHLDISKVLLGLLDLAASSDRHIPQMG